ncbi:hypothetical protein [Paenibacillus sp. 481]|uniref:hypothetical protein n=1 Tax=Paenibacillus sp. 481 TaxID=2835869 RepID=UPI001E436EC4|nr:hypothetical protein [Paenibacillus sp. 481]UHA74423.1 hypothetical protein KIK04_04765 [Paenibacillus sp. 481]
MRYVGIDPATKTGLVVLNSSGELLKAAELLGEGSTSVRRIRMLANEVFQKIKNGDVVCIEGFALAARDTNKVASGNGWAARMAVDRHELHYIEVGTSQLKKFVNVSQWSGQKGSKQRLSNKAVKQLVIESVFQHWGFSTKSDNIADAFVLAKIAEAVHKVNNGLSLIDFYPRYQLEVIQSILHPEKKKKRA